MCVRACVRVCGRVCFDNRALTTICYSHSIMLPWSIPSSITTYGAMDDGLGQAIIARHMAISLPFSHLDYNCEQVLLLSHCLLGLVADL